MRAADGYQTYILGSAAAYTLASQSASGPTTYDGTAFVAEFIDDYLFGPQQALFYSTAQVYSETAETYDASDWLSALARYICRIVFAEKPYVNLVILRASASTVDIDATSIYVGWKKHESVNLTLDITASGALGLDTGTESADAWYYIWLLSKLDGTLTGVLSASATVPTLPTGYIFSKLVGAVRNTSGDFVAFYQENNLIRYISAIQAASAATSISETFVDISSLIPVNTKTVLYSQQLEISGFTNTGIWVSYIKSNYGTTAFDFQNITKTYLSTSDLEIKILFGEFTTNNQRLYYRSYLNSGTTPTVANYNNYIRGFELNI